MDPSSYHLEMNQLLSAPALSGAFQNFTCSILPRTITPDVTVSVIIGDGSFCTVLGLAPRYSLHVATNGSNICVNKSSTCKTQIILTTMYEDDTEETRLHDASSYVYRYDFTRIDLHYQTCGDDVLTFSLPVSSSVPLTVTCSAVSDNNPARPSDYECGHLYVDPPGLLKTTSSKSGKSSF